MDLFTKIIRGDGSRRSRFHDEKGNLAPWRHIALHAPPALVSGFLRLAVGHRPALPWIAYASIAYLKGFLTRESRVLEFGSGMSTLWYARHAGEVCSVEDDPLWYEKVAGLIEAAGIGNVSYRFAPDEEEYAAFMSDDREGFDLVMIDGNHRSRCVAHAAGLVRPGGILYLDNSDKDPLPRGGDMRLAEELARGFAGRANARITEITDFAPTQLFVQQALRIELPGRPAAPGDGGDP